MTQQHNLLPHISLLWKVLFMFVALQLPGYRTQACTSIIVTGKHTADGRPLMWKHRDTSQPTNHMVYLQGERFNFIGLMNSNRDGDIWVGTNTAGFSIMNTASFNLKDDDVKDMDKEGLLMRRALEVCATTADFEHFLDTLRRPMRVEANFGVIDAQGGAAYYETNNHRYFKRDANDPRLAPEGYLLCTNFSFNGKEDKGLGYIRYASAAEIVKPWKAADFTPERLFWEGSNSFYNAQTGINLYHSTQNAAIAPNGWVLENDFIARRESTAAMVIQGVKKGENPEMVTLWTELGYPPLAFAVPLWVKMADRLPALVTYRDDMKTAPLCRWSTDLKNTVYPIRRGSGARYLNWGKMWNTEGNGYLQRLRPAWQKVYNRFASELPKWRKHGLDLQEVEALYVPTATEIEAYYREVLPSFKP